MNSAIFFKARRRSPQATKRVLLSVFLLALVACDDDPAAELPVWTPEDHRNQGTPGASQVEVGADRPNMPALEKHGIDDVILATWKQNCTPCHGLIGRGDGPRGRNLRPPDLTDPTWQERAIDSEIASTIKRGRGKMPAFGHLPDKTIQGLVRLVRMLNRKRSQGDPSAGDSSAESSGEEGSTPPASDRRGNNLPPGHP